MPPRPVARGVSAIRIALKGWSSETVSSSTNQSWLGQQHKGSLEMELRLQSRTAQRAIGKIGVRDRTQLAVMAMA